MTNPSQNNPAVLYLAELAKNIDIFCQQGEFTGRVIVAPDGDGVRLTMWRIEETARYRTRHIGWHRFPPIKAAAGIAQFEVQRIVAEIKSEMQKRKETEGSQNGS